MKTIILMRHGKSSWKDSSLEDHERPLKKRGRRDSATMSALLKKHKLVPDKILSSSAVRASQTAEIVVEELKFDGKLEFLDELYMAEPSTIIDILKDVKDKHDRVLVIGHNPGMEGIMQILDGKVECLPTAAVACLELDIKSWQDLKADGEAKLVKLWLPRDQKK